MKISVESIETGSQWSAYLLPTAFPPANGQKRDIGLFLREVTFLLEEESGLHREVFLHSWRLHIADTGKLMHHNLQTWMPKLGMGVWPDRCPPSLWTEEAFMDAAASMMKKEEPELTAYRLIHLEGSGLAKRSAAEAVFGAGATTQIFSVLTYEEIERRGEEQFQPSIIDSIYKHERFYLPLIDLRSIAAARNSEQFDRWLCGADVYVRESAEDEGVLFLSRQPLETVFSKAEERVRVEEGS